MATYGYLNPMANFDNGKTPLTCDEQRVAIDKKVSSEFSWIFAEDSRCQLSAFQMMLNSLKPSDSVVVWDWRCFVDPTNLAKASADIWDKILRIHQASASLHFVNGDYETKTAKGRYLLTLSVANAQFEHDRQLEEATTSTTSCCCTKTSSTGC